MALRNMIIVVVSFLAVACAPAISITSDFDKQVDFNKYQTFSVKTGDSSEDPSFPNFDNQLNRRRIKDAIVKEMRQIGYQLKSENPDLELDFHIVIKDKTVTTQRGWGHRRYLNAGVSETFEYTQGTLVIHVVDPTNELLIWQGAASSTLREQSSKAEERINTAVSKIFSKYPKQ